MEVEIRELHTAEELEDVVRLEMAVGGLPERHVTSPITLSAISITHPRVGWVVGAYEQDKMVGFCLTLSTQEPGLVYGFMLAVDPKAQNGGIGGKLLKDSFDLYREDGVERVCWTYEPMEARNAHLYLNKLGARGTRYLREYYYLQTGLHEGLPQDRLMVELGVDEFGSGKLPAPLEQVLAKYPVARAGHLPDADAVLVEIPHKMHELLPRDPQAAGEFRENSRAAFEHYVNDLGYAAVSLHWGDSGQGPKSYYLLARR